MTIAVDMGRKATKQTNKQDPQYEKADLFFMKEQRNIRQKSGCLNHSNEQIFQVIILMQGPIKDSWKGGSYV